MLCIGNDIVDLNVSENREKSRDRRFLDRAFTPDEREMIEQTGHPDTMLWAIWAAKEGAYKAVSKKNPGLSSSPRRYGVVFRNTGPASRPDAAPGGVLSGLVHTPAGEVSFRTLLAPRYVHCLALAGIGSYRPGVISRVLPLNDVSDQSSALRSAANNHLASLTGADPSVIDIRRFKTPTGFGPPEVFVAGRRADIDVSLSHDGGYGAFAFRL